jgi:hypothetical protein
MEMEQAHMVPWQGKRSQHANRLRYHHQLERERVHLHLIDEASMGLDDIVAGRVKDARSVIQCIKRRRSA